LLLKREEGGASPPRLRGPITDEVAMPLSLIALGLGLLVLAVAALAVLLILGNRK
jgi:hypothetical protein